MLRSVPIYLITMFTYCFVKFVRRILLLSLLLTYIVALLLGNLHAIFTVTRLTQCLRACKAFSINTHVRLTRSHCRVLVACQLEIERSELGVEEDGHLYKGTHIVHM